MEVIMGSNLILDDAVAWEYPFEQDAYLRGIKIVKPENPTIHFLHGNGLCGKTYWPMLEGLTEKYSLITHDCVGHGDSDPGQGFVSWEQSAEHVYAVIQHKIKKGDIQGSLLGLGHSFGGVLTLKLAAR